MALKSFKVEERKSIKLAVADSVPPVMVIAGPNGVGKSTLLFAIKEGGRVADEGTRFFYQGPHRVLRRTTVQRKWLGGAVRSMLDLLGMNEVSGFEGLNFFNPTRTPENVDEAGSTIKHTLGKIENRRQTLLAQTVDRLKSSGESFDLTAVPDIYEPLRKLPEFLLAHLIFEKVDFTNEENIRCSWKRTDSNGSISVDIDDLSSGEKAIVVLFLPLLEEQIQARVKELERFGNENAEETSASEDRVILIDEPEQHLHPDLQAKILTYMRNVSQSTHTQFIITTHSPTILDQAFDTELFVLSPPSENAEENQLRKIATNAERLEALKQLTGSTYFLTTGRVIVCIEGEGDSDPDKPTDARLLEILYPRATAVTLVPTTGKGNVINTVTKLREHVPEETYRIKIRGLVDADQSRESIDGIETLPVSMIENLLLESGSIYEFMRSVGITNLNNAEAVSETLKEIAQGFREKEIELRTRRRLKSRTVRLGGADVATIKAKHEQEIDEIKNLLPSDEILKELVRASTAEVEEIISSGNQLNHFRGKNILESFYQRQIASANIGYNQFCIGVAKIIAQKGSIAAKLDPVFQRLIS